MSEFHCTRCGAQINGPFCSQCGYDNRGEISQLQSPPQPTVYENNGKKKKKISCLTIVLILFIIGVVSCSLNKEKREAAKDLAKSIKNYVIAKEMVKELSEISDSYEKNAPASERKTKEVMRNAAKTEPAPVSRDIENNSATAFENNTGEMMINTIKNDHAPSSGEMVDGMRKEFKEAMDAYEAFYDSYFEYFEMVDKAPDDFQWMQKYGEMMAKAAEADAAFERWNEDEDMNPEEIQYYFEVQGRVLKRMAEQ